MVKDFVEVHLNDSFEYMSSNGEKAHAKMIKIQAPCYAQKDQISDLRFILTGLVMKAVLDQRNGNDTQEAPADNQGGMDESGGADIAKLALLSYATIDEFKDIRERVKSLLISDHNWEKYRKKEELICLVDGDTPLLSEMYMFFSPDDLEEVLYSFLGSYGMSSMIRGR